MYLKTRQKVYFLVLEYLQLLHFSFYSGENWKFMIENFSFMLLSNCKVFKWNVSVAKHLELKFLSVPQKLISEFESRWNLRYLCSLSEIKPQKSKSFGKVLVSYVKMIHAILFVITGSVVNIIIFFSFWQLFHRSFNFLFFTFRKLLYGIGNCGNSWNYSFLITISVLGREWLVYWYL